MAVSPESVLSKWTMAAARGSPFRIAVLTCVLAAAADAQEPPPDIYVERETGGDGCRGERSPDQQGIDTVRAGIQRGVCSTARFIDGLFGRENQYSEYEDESNGRASVTLGWDQQNEFEIDTRFRASVNLPQINERFNATIGRASSDEYLADEIGVFNPAVSAFSDDDPAEWFAGVGYRAHRGRDSRFDLGAGVKLESPLNPYANARYRRYFYRPSGVLWTLRTTFFVENDEGFGVTQAFDVDKVLTDAYLLRLSNSLRLSEETDGVRWRIRPALYQAIDYRRAMRYEAYVRGETESLDLQIKAERSDRVDAHTALSGELELHGPGLAGGHPHERLLDLLDEAAGADLHDVVALAALARGVDQVDHGDVAGLRRPVVDRGELRNRGAERVELCLDQLVRHRHLGAGNLELRPVG